MIITMKDGKEYSVQYHENGTETYWRYPRVIRGKAIKKAYKKVKNRGRNNGKLA